MLAPTTCIRAHGCMANGWMDLWTHRWIDGWVDYGWQDGGMNGSATGLRMIVERVCRPVKRRKEESFSSDERRNYTTYVKMESDFLYSCVTAQTFD